MNNIFKQIFAVSEQIRYVALYQNGGLEMSSRPGLENASAAESDKYEELIVNPALLTLTRQRGEIDCGGLNFLLIRYGNFFQFIRPFGGGHVSVCFVPEAGVLSLFDRLEKTVFY